mgnify:CR=1 FL=1
MRPKRFRFGEANNMEPIAGRKMSFNEAEAFPLRRGDENDETPAGDK